MTHDLFGNSSVSKTLPLGLPYRGSKRKYADVLICKMLEHKPNAKYFYDVCGGGGAMSFAAMQKGMTVVYNEKQTGIVDLMRFIFRCVDAPQGEYGIFPNEWYDFITREDFTRLKSETGAYAEYARICYSFGNNQRNYLYGKEKEAMKHLAHDVVVFQSDVALKKLNVLINANLKLSALPNLHERRLDFYKQIRSCGDRLDLQQLENLARLQHLERLRGNFTILNLDYRDVEITTPIEETIVYCDPPYRGTEKYIEGICHNELDAWFVSLPYLAFMSEYNAPFHCVHEIKTRSTMSASSNSVARVEKLYVNHAV